MMALSPRMRGRVRFLKWSTRRTTALLTGTSCSWPWRLQSARQDLASSLRKIPLIVKEVPLERGRSNSFSLSRALEKLIRRCRRLFRVCSLQAINPSARFAALGLRLSASAFLPLSESSRSAEQFGTSQSSRLDRFCGGHTVDRAFDHGHEVVALARMIWKHTMPAPRCAGEVPFPGEWMFAVRSIR